MNGCTKKWWRVGLVALCLSSVALAAQPEGRGQRNQGAQVQRSDPVARLAASLEKMDLSAEQKQRIEGVMKESKPALTRAQQAHAQATRALNQAAAKEESEAAIMTAAQQVGKALGSMTVQRVKVMAKLRSVLTPEQQQQLKQAMRPARPERTEAQAKEKRSREPKEPKEGKKKKQVGN
jgi:Spy/CpxP family protein refolding chaperone